MVGSGAWDAREPSFDEPGDPCHGLDAHKEEEPPSERAIEEELLSAPKLFKQALQQRWEGPF